MTSEQRFKNVEKPFSDADDTHDECRDEFWLQIQRLQLRCLEYRA